MRTFAGIAVLVLLSAGVAGAQSPTAEPQKPTPLTGAPGSRPAIIMPRGIPDPSPSVPSVTPPKVKSFIADISWWNILNTSLSGVIVGAIVSVVLFFLNAASQRRLAKIQLQNNVFVRFGELGQEMWFLSGRAQALHGNPQYASELTAVRLQMLSRQGALRALRLPILLHFGSDETLAERLKKMGDLFERIRNLLGEATLNRPVYEAQQDSFHECYAKLYADLALRIEKRERAKPFEIDHVAKIVMTK